MGLCFPDKVADELGAAGVGFGLMAQFVMQPLDVCVHVFDLGRLVAVYLQQMDGHLLVMLLEAFMRLVIEHDIQRVTGDDRGLYFLR